jgi:hypothetical protein
MQAVTPLHKRAVVIGDGLAGLLAAQALADFFQQVLVIAQPSPPDGPPVLLHGRDQDALEKLFPGLVAALLAAGAVRFNLGLHVAWSVNGRWRPRYCSSLVSLACSHSLLEEALKQRLAGHTSIRFLWDETVSGLEVDTAVSQATGIRLATGTDAGAHALSADLVVDASGQMDRALGWLHTLGLKGTAPCGGSSPLAAAGRLYQRPPVARESWQMLVAQPAGAQARRAAVILPLEGERLHLTLFGTGTDAPPLTEEGFLDFARALPTSIVAEIMQQAAPLSAVQPVRMTGCSTAAPPSLARFILLPEPDRAPNPVLRQTVSHALNSRAALYESMAGGLVGVNGRCQQYLSENLRPLCLLARTETERWAGVVEMGSEPMSRYMEQVLAASLHSADVLEVLYLVQQMIEPPLTLFRPDIVLQVSANGRQ